MSTGRGGKDRLVGNALISSMLKMGLSYIEIQALFKCGKGRICRVNNPGKYSREANENSTWLKVRDKENFVKFMETLDTQQGFACAHRKPLFYTTEQGLSWKKLYDRYKQELEAQDPPARVISLSR